MTTPELELYNTLTSKKKVFEPVDPENVRMHVCGPRLNSPKSGHRFSDQLFSGNRAGGSL